MTLESTLEMYASDQLLEDSDFSVMVRDTENSLKDNLLVTFWCVRPLTHFFFCLLINLGRSAGLFFFSIYVAGKCTSKILEKSSDGMQFIL